MLAAGVLLALALCACSGNPLPDGMEEGALLDAGREVVELLNEQDYQAVYDRMRADGQEASSVDDLETYMEALLEKAGPYVQEESSMATGQKLDSGERYGTAVFYCKHEKDDVVYRIAFSTDMELMGLQATTR